MFTTIRNITKFSSNSIRNTNTLLNLPTKSTVNLNYRLVHLPNNKMANALVIIAEGSEEMEAVITSDVLRRGKINTTIAGLKSADPVKCSCGVIIKPDMSLEEAAKHAYKYDAIVLPGGLAGSEAFCSSSLVGELLKKQEAAGKICAAICAAPTAFKQHGIGAGKSLTSYPGMAEKFKGTDYKYKDDQDVVVDGKLVTSRGPGTSFVFGLKLVELLVDKKTSDEIKAAMLVK